MFIGNQRRFWIVAALAAIFAIPSFAQRAKKPRGGHVQISIVKKHRFVPTCNLDSNSVGFYFYPPNLGAEWTLRTVSQILDASSNVLKSDTTYSFEKIISDSNRSLQGLPVLRCISSMPYHAGQEDSAKLSSTEYYVDDSVIMTVFDHSVTSVLNHILLVNPLKLGASWKDVSNDTIRTVVTALHDSVSVPYGSFKNALVVMTPAGFGRMTKYFVPGVGLVKIVFHGIPPQQNGTFLVTSELIALDRGNPKRNIKYQFQALEHPKRKSVPRRGRPKRVIH